MRATNFHRHYHLDVTEGLLVAACRVLKSMASAPFWTAPPELREHEEHEEVEEHEERPPEVDARPRDQAVRRA